MKFRLRWCGFVLLVAVLLPHPLWANELPVAEKKADAAWLVPDLLDEDEEFDEVAVEVSDPLEGLNRISFVFNDTLYVWVIKPVRRGYMSVVPEDFRKVFGNFFYNLKAPVRLVNKLLQGRFREAGVVVARFAINSTVGVLGFGDIAAETFDLAPQPADLGQTLAGYGLGEGCYLYLPLLGPSNLRDSVGLVGDALLYPVNYADVDTVVSVSRYGVEFVNKISITPDVYEEMKRISLDPYVAIRQAHSEYRRAFIENNEM